MFDRVLSKLRDLEKGTQIAVPVKADDRGFLDKQCPVQECMFVFKVHEVDWAEKLRGDDACCPRCGGKAPRDHWWTEQQIEHAQEQGQARLISEVMEALAQDCRQMDRELSRGMLRSKTSIRGHHGIHTIVPAAAVRAWETEIVCDECSCRFAVLGCAYFCPACGKNSVERTFDESVRKVLVRVDRLGEIRGTLEADGHSADAAMIIQAMVESALQDCVVAFQRLAEELYRGIPGQPTPPKNVFQRLQQGSALWKTAVQEGYGDWVSPTELDTLNIMFQRRHLLAHKEGLVDQEYLDKTGDGSYKVGQRIVVTERDVREMVRLIRTLADSIRKHVQP